MHCIVKLSSQFRNMSCTENGIAYGAVHHASGSSSYGARLLVVDCHIPWNIMAYSYELLGQSHVRMGSESQSDDFTVAQLQSNVHT